MTTVAVLAQRISNEFRTHGIFRDSDGFPPNFPTGDNDFNRTFTGPTCLIANRTLDTEQSQGGLMNVLDYQRALLDAVVEIGGYGVVSWLETATDEQVHTLLYSLV